MCGITGFVQHSTSNELLASAVIHAMTEKLRHRGPDGEGYILWNRHETVPCYGADTPVELRNSESDFQPKIAIQSAGSHLNFAMGHRRLSVIGGNIGGHQPMCYDKGNLWIVFNGAIYNYIELRKELEQFGHQFSSQSDTEVLLAAYRQYGNKCLAKLNGMWAFAIYDKEKNIIFGARDRFGVKPLYYCNNAEYFAFASEPKALLSIPNNQAKISHQAIYEYLAYSKVDYGNISFYENITELLPSEMFTFDLISLTFSKQNYYTLPINTENTAFNRIQVPHYAETVRHLLSEAISIRQRADIPVGFCLSGGLDSTAILSIAQLGNSSTPRNTNQAFTATNTNTETDELNWAQLVAEKCNTQLHPVDCTAEGLMHELHHIIYHQDVPLISSGTYAQYNIMQTASSCGIKVLLSGQGSDELFGGYNEFYTAHALYLFKHQEWKKLHQLIQHIGNSPLTKSVYIKYFIKQLIGKMPVRVRKKISQSLTPAHKWMQQGQHTYILDLTNNHKDVPPLNTVLADQLAGHPLRGLLRWEDRCSMAFGIESRTPFADDIHLIEYVFSLPSNYKLADGWSKYILRQATKGIIPTQITTRTDKLGYATPQDIWTRTLASQLKLIAQNSDDQIGLINKKQLIKDWDSVFANGSPQERSFIWRYTNLLIWQNQLKQ